MADLSERMLSAFLVQMIKAEAVDPDDIAEAADTLEGQGDEEAAHAMRCIILEAASPSPSDWQADQRRNRFRVIDSEAGKTE